MARSELVDPLSKFTWKLKIDGFTRAGFTACQTPSYDITTYNYSEGGAHLTPRQIMDKISYPPITISRGVTADSSFNRWATGLFDIVQGNQGINVSGTFDTSPLGDLGGVINQVGLNGPQPEPSFQSSGDILGEGKGKNYRKDITIQHVNKKGQLVVEYNLFGAWPVNYKVASDFDATDDEGFSIESLTLAYDGFDVRYGSLTSAAASTII